MGKIAILLFGLSITATAWLFGAFKPGLELSTGTEQVEVLLKPVWKGHANNKIVGLLPPHIKIDVEDEIIGKDFLFYEVDFISSDGVRLRGYVISGSKGLIINESKWRKW